MKKLLLMSLVALFMYSCGSDDTDDMQDQEDQAIMEVEKDGVPFTITEFNNTLVVDSQGDEEGRRLDLRANVDGGTLIITVSNWDWQNPPENGILTKSYDTNSDFDGPNTACVENGAFTFCDGGLGTYLLNNVPLITESVDGEGEGIITISENDPANKTVSGSFDFTVQQLGTSEKITFKGTFSDLSYF